MNLSRANRRWGFTLIEVMIAIGILGLVIAAIYSSWTAILRSSKVGLEAAAAVQRERIAMRMMEDALSAAQMFVASADYYAFVAENGSDASLSFVARLSKAFPRSGKFGDFDVRRVTFSVEPGATSEKQLVLRQNPILMELDAYEKDHPVVLARGVKEFRMEFWDAQLNDWVDEWVSTNQLPKLVKMTLTLRTSSRRSVQAQDEVTRIVGLPTSGVQPGWQVPTSQGGGGSTINRGNQGGNQGGTKGAVRGGTPPVNQRNPR